MNIYASLNEMIEYIEENLENKIEYSKLAQIVNINENMLPNFFSMLCNISLSDYEETKFNAKFTQTYLLDKYSMKKV